jgi:hypothetical protein
MLSLGDEPLGNEPAEPATGNDEPRRMEDQQAVRKGGDGSRAISPFRDAKPSTRTLTS